MKQKYLLSVILVYFWMLTPIFAQVYIYPDGKGKTGISLKKSTRNGAEISFSLSKLELNDLQAEGKLVHQLNVEGNFLPNNEGAPDLPGFSKYIAIPEGAEAKIRIRSYKTETIRNIDLSPAPRIPLETEDHPLRYIKDEKIYSTNAYYPAEPFILSRVTEIRGVDAVILGITPFQYNPVSRELIVYYAVDVEVEFTGGNGRFGDDRLRSRWFDPILQDALLNYDALPKIDYNARNKNRSGRETGYEYLIVIPNDDAWMPYAEQIKEWRTKQGISTGIVTLNDIGGSTVSVLENYFNTAFNTWDIPPVAVLLMADYGTDATNRIIAPIWDNYCVSDNIFADVNNSDMPDIIFARMTAQNTTHLETMVSKMLDYEASPPTDYNFYHKPITALGWQTERWFQICSETVGGYWREEKGKEPVRINAIYEGTPGSTWSTAPNTSSVVNYFGPNGQGYITATPAELGGWSGGTATHVINAINDGAFALQHRDHGYEYGWGEPSFNTSSISSLTNNQNNELVFVFSINCLTGKYNISGESFAEKFHRYTFNGQNAGALGLIAASEVSYSFVNDTYVWGMFDNIYPDFLPTYGPLVDERGFLPAFGNAAGKYFLQQSNWPYNTNSKEVTYNLFHHHGGAFLQVYSEVPQNLTVNHAPVLYSGENTFSVTANAGSFIALSLDGEIIGTAEGTGAPVSIAIEPQVPPAEMIVTVTKQNYFRYESAVDILPPSGPYVVFDSYEINDYADNNGNGQADYGETIWLSMTLKNVGVETATSVNTVISSGDQYVNITGNQASFGDIPANATVTITDAFVFDLSEDVPDQHPVNFTLTATDQGKATWESYFSVIANAPALKFTGYIVDDTGGNNNGILDPGETAPVKIIINNNGGASATGIEAALSTTDAYLTIETTGSQTYGNLDPGQSAFAIYTVTADAGTPGGHISEASLDITADFGIVQQETVEFSFADYCYPTANCSYGDGFTGFAVGDISNLNSGCSSGGYGDFLSMSTELEPGSTYTVQWKTGYSDQYACLWIDLNNNRTFEESELLISDFHLTSAGTLYSTDFTVPADAYPGNKRMRIRGNWQNSAANPCSDFSYGETEDYTVTIVAAEPPVADFTASQTLVMEGGNVSFTDLSTNNPTNWSWTFTGGTPATSSGQNPVVTYNNAGSYSVKLTASNPSGSDTETKLNYIQVVALPGCAGLVSPGDGATGIALSTGLKWAAADNANGYRIFFGTDYPPTNIENGTDIGDVLLYSPGSLDYETTYFWRIVAYNNYGETSGCPTWSFTTEDEPIYPPDCVTLSAPEDQATGVSIATGIEWNPVSGATGYRFYFGTDNPPTNIEQGTNLGNTTTYTPSGELDFLTPYYWQVVAYNEAGMAVDCEIWSFTTEPDPDPPAHFQPVWTSPFNPMSVFITEALWGGNDLQPGDEIGLFDTDPVSGNEICVGAARLTEVLGNGNFLEIIASMDDGSNPDLANGFTSGNTIIYKYWNDMTGELDGVQANYPYQGYDEVYTSQGTAFAELFTSTTIQQNIPLTPGWNMISFRAEPENMDMMSIVQPLINLDVFYKIIDENGGSVFHLPFPPPNGQWSNTIGDMACTEGYYLKVYDDCELGLEGSPTLLPMDIGLTAGWNIISYPCSGTADAMNVVQPLIDAGVLYKVVDENGGTIFHLPFPPPNGQWSNTIGNFESGEGYYIKVTEDIILTMNEPAEDDEIVDIRPVIPTSYFQPVYQGNPYLPMHVMLTGNGLFNAGDEIAVFDGDICVGAAVYQNDIVIIPCSADDPETSETDGYISGNDLQIRAWNHQSGHLYGNIEFMLIEGDGQYSELGTDIYRPDAFTGMSNNFGYPLTVSINPNPVKEVALITLSLPQQGNVDIRVCDILGNELSVLIQQQAGAGLMTFELNTAELPQGYYLLKFGYENTTGISEGYQKFIVIK